MPRSDFNTYLINNELTAAKAASLTCSISETCTIVNTNDTFSQTLIIVDEVSGIPVSNISWNVNNKPIYSLKLVINLTEF